MGEKTSIEWTDSTWNPIRARRRDNGKVGWHCEKVSPACTNCYAAAMNLRGLTVGTGLDYTARNRENVDIFVDEKTLVKPLSWRKGRKIFVCSMTDLFAEFVQDYMIDAVLSVAAANPRHTFQFLTKRPERMYRYFAGLQRAADEWAPQTVEKKFTPTQVLNLRMLAATITPGGFLGRAFDAPWPLPNVWLGVTVENQEQVERRIPHLLECPAAIRFVSIEPLLGPVDLSRCVPSSDGFVTTAEDGPWHVDDGAPQVDWVIVGGESGAKARPTNPFWIRTIRDQCEAAGIPFLFKQWGEWAQPSGWQGTETIQRKDYAWFRDRGYMNGVTPMYCVATTGSRSEIGKLTEYRAFPSAFDDDAESTDVAIMHRVGKGIAGRLLDGREWNEFPQAKGTP